MTNEQALDTNNAMDTNETKKEELTESLASTEPTAVSTVEDAQTVIEKPKRPGRKKRDLSLTSEVKIENSNNDIATDTQPLFEQPVILEGKRSRKPTSRLELSDLATPKKELTIPEVNYLFH